MSVHYLGQSLLPLCEEAGENVTAGGYTATPVVEDVTCSTCIEWVHA